MVVRLADWGVGLGAGLALIWAFGGCGSDASDVPAGGSGGSSGSGGGSTQDAGGGAGSGGGTAGGSSGSGGSAGAEGGAAGTSSSDAGSDAALPPETTALDPCATAPCWNNPTLGACGTRTVKEDFASGQYGVHRQLVLPPKGVSIKLSVERTGGTWDPILVVHDDQGATVFDGKKTHSTNALQVKQLSASANSVGVELSSATGGHLSAFVTSQGVADSNFKDVLPTDAKYTLTADVGCPAQAPLEVRGVALDAKQDLWVRFIAHQVVPDVPGNSAERSAYVTWWALKEGVLNVNNPLSYSNCSFPPDMKIGPLEECPDPGNAWQVGLSGVQAAYRTLSSVEKLAAEVFGQKPVPELLQEAGILAGFGADTGQGKAIVASKDRVRLSWLLRHSAIGFHAQYQPVYDQCFVDQKSWCFGTGWKSSADFAPNQTAAKQAVADLQAIFASPP